MKRRPSRPGLSYFDANRGRLITIENDVLGVKQQIQERWPMLDVYFDEVDEVWCIVCLTPTPHQEDYLVFSTPRLDGRVIERLERADNERNSEDPLDIVDRENEELKREDERRFSDRIGDFGERLLFAMKKDGLLNHEYLPMRNRRA